MSSKGKKGNEVCYRFRYVLPILFVLLLLISAVYSAQSESEGTTLSLNMLLPPISPAFVVMEDGPTSVERPGNPTDFALSFLKATDSLRTLPRDYAAEFTPYWWGKPKHTHTSDFIQADNPWQNILQTATISLAFSTRPYPSGDTSDIYMGVGLRCSALRGEINPDHQKVLKKTLNDFNDFYVERIQELIDENSAIKNLRVKLKEATTEGDSIRIINQIGEREDTLKAQFIKRLQTDPSENLSLYTEFTRIDRRVEQAAALLRFHRVGPVLDLAGAGIIDFPQAVLKDAQFSRWGAWATGGYGWRKFSSLGVVRYLGNLAETDSSRLDLGVRGIWNATDKLSVSGEGLIYKYSDPDDSEWHLQGGIIIDFALWKNNTVSLSVGLNEGILAHSINFKQGFGSKRPILIGPTEEETTEQ